MAMKYTEEQLNKFNKATLVQLFLATQEQLESIDSKLQLVLEQLAVANSKRFGRSSEKMAPDNQIASEEVFKRLPWNLCDGRISGLPHTGSRTGRSDHRRMLGSFQTLL